MQTDILNGKGLYYIIFEVVRITRDIHILIYFLIYTNSYVKLYLIIFRINPTHKLLNAEKSEQCQFLIIVPELGVIDLVQNRATLFFWGITDFFLSLP